MIVDERVLECSGPPYDVVVVGGGAAGLCLAQKLEGGRRRVLVIEAGGARETRLSRTDHSGEVTAGSSHPPADLYRVRALGGTSRIWGGRCIPFDPIDFEARTWVAGPGWPVPYDAVAGYYPAALAAAEGGDFAFDPAEALPGALAELLPGLDGGPIVTTLERFSRPTDFWVRYGRALRSAFGIHVLPQAAVTAIRLRPDGGAVDHLVVVARSGRQHTVRAALYVLAGGGLETTRLLLASDDVMRSGIGNAGDQLGRNYMSHLCATAGTVSLDPSRGPAAFDYARDAQGIYVRRRLSFVGDAQRRHRLLNTTFRTHLPDPGDPDHGDAVLSAMFLSKRLVQREYASKFSEAPVGLPGYGRHIGNVVRQPRALSRFAALWLRRRILADRKLPSVVRPPFGNRYVLEFHAEQSPDPASRVTLGPDCDRLGVRRLRIDWHVQESDIESLRRVYILLGQRMAETGVGRLDVDLDLMADRARRLGIVGGHHIGLTRMSRDPRTGVVDPDCRVHGVPNLYVASASVLPTSGQANPTLTVLALALRLADRLERVLEDSPAIEIGRVA